MVSEILPSVVESLPIPFSMEHLQQGQSVAQLHELRRFFNHITAYLRSEDVCVARGLSGGRCVDSCCVKVLFAVSSFVVCVFGLCYANSSSAAGVGVDFGCCSGF